MVLEGKFATWHRPSFAISRDGTVVVARQVRDRGAPITVYEPRTGRSIRTLDFELPDEFGIRTMALSDDGSVLAAEVDGSAKKHPKWLGTHLFDLRTGKKKRVLNHPQVVEGSGKTTHTYQQTQHLIGFADRDVVLASTRKPLQRFAWSTGKSRNMGMDECKNTAHHVGQPNIVCWKSDTMLTGA